MKRSLVKSTFSAATFGAIAIVATGLSTTTADAKIKCKGPYQVVKGVGTIATPYCQDNYIGQIARSRGMRVSNKQIRNNPAKKKEACIFLSNDIRVQDFCDPYRFRRGKGL